tara:strand:+ start:181 stop:582 length:402 start_codon:yes stop_codon:yes gene_type:complete
MMYPSAKAQNAIQKNPAEVKAALLQFERKSFIRSYISLSPGNQHLLKVSLIPGICNIFAGQTTFTLDADRGDYTPSLSRMCDTDSMRISGKKQGECQRSVFLWNPEKWEEFLSDIRESYGICREIPFRQTAES